MITIPLRPASEASRLQRRVLDELEWDSAVDTSRLQISVDRESQVTLQGVVHTLTERRRVEDLVKRIRGVAGVVNRLEVRLSIGDYRTDATLVRVLGELFDCLAQMPEQRPRVTVKDGWVTLEGEVPLGFQRALMEDAVRSVAGVRGIDNRLVVVPCAPPATNLDAVLSQLVRRRAIGGRGIEITAADGRVTLRGTVRSCAERDELLGLAWGAAGVRAVEDHVVVG